MGMYTEIYVNVEFIKEVPDSVIDLIKVMTGEISNNESIKKPSHDLFKTTRWWQLLNSSSFYHIPFIVVNLKKHETSNTWYLTARADLKNYDSEIELFFDWIKPYVCDNGHYKTFMGYSRHEDWDEPNLYFK